MHKEVENEAGSPGAGEPKTSDESTNATSKGITSGSHAALRQVGHEP